MELREQLKLVNSALSKTLDLYRIWAKKKGISYNALLILYTLDDYKVCTPTQICQWWALPKQTVHGILQDFEKQGYIDISANWANKRERLISFTEKGKLFSASILMDLHLMEENVMKQMGEESCQQLITSNTMYYQLLKKEIENE